MRNIKNRLIIDSLKIFEAIISYKVGCECGRIYHRNKRKISCDEGSKMPYDKSKCPNCGRVHVFAFNPDVTDSEDLKKSIEQVTKEHEEVLTRRMRSW